MWEEKNNSEKYRMLYVMWIEYVAFIEDCKIIFLPAYVEKFE